MNQTVLLTGGTGKLGQVLLKAFLERGHTVLFTCSRAESLESTLERHQEFSKNLKGYVVNFAVTGSVESLVSQITLDGFLPNTLVNNARDPKFLTLESDGRVSRENFLGEFTVDVVAPYELTHLLAAAQNSRLRYVVNVGSQYGVVAANPALYEDYKTHSPLHYSVAKAALGHLTRELSIRFAEQGIRVNCVAFGGFSGRVDDAFLARYKTLAPLGRMLEDSEVVGPVEYLMSEASSGMTGQVMNVDCGWSVW